MDNHIWEDTFADLDSNLHDATFATILSNGAPYHGNRTSVINPILAKADPSRTTVKNDSRRSLQPQSNTTVYNSDTFSTSTFPEDPNVGVSDYLQDKIMPAPAIPDAGTPRYPPIPQAPPASLSEYACVHPGCLKKYSRRPDMRRHAKVHDPNATMLNCPFPNCPRKGRQGFPRSDKLLAHERAHRRAIQKAREGTSRQG